MVTENYEQVMVLFEWRDANIFHEVPRRTQRFMIGKSALFIDVRIYSPWRMYIIRVWKSGLLSSSSGCSGSSSAVTGRITFINSLCRLRLTASSLRLETN